MLDCYPSIRVARKESAVRNLQAVLKSASGLGSRLEVGSGQAHHLIELRIHSGIIINLAFDKKPTIILFAMLI